MYLIHYFFFFFLSFFWRKGQLNRHTRYRPRLRFVTTNPNENHTMSVPCCPHTARGEAGGDANLQGRPTEQTAKTKSQLLFTALFGMSMSALRSNFNPPLYATRPKQ
jgi:hypothetical protein